MNSLHFCLYEEVFIFPPPLKANFTGYRIVGQCFFLLTLNIALYSLPTLRFLRGWMYFLVSLQIRVPLPSTLKIFYSSLVFCSFNVPRCYFLGIYSAVFSELPGSGLVSVINFGEFSVTITSPCSFAPFSLYLLKLSCTPWLFLSRFFLSLFISVWETSAAFYSSSLILLLAVSNCLTSPSKGTLYFCYSCFFFFFNF